MIQVSVVIPVYRCDSTLTELYERTSGALESADLEFEIILVHDGCTQESWNKIQELASRDRRVRGIKLSRNFGQHPAIMAGIRLARGLKVAVMDCDLQDPVELLPRFIRKSQEADIVLSLRDSRGDSSVRRFQAGAYTKLLRFLTGKVIDSRLGGISVIDQKVAREYAKFVEPDHHFLYILVWLGFTVEYIEIERTVRNSGRSSYSLFDRLRHAARGAFFFSSRVITFFIAIGLLLFTFGILLLLVVLLSSVRGSPTSGWLSLVSLLILFSGFNVALTSIVGLYVTRIFEKVKDRPLYVVDTEV